MDTAPPHADTAASPALTADRAAIRRFLETQLGRTEGFLAWVIGHDPHIAESGKYNFARWEERKTVWPTEKMRLVEAMARAAEAGHEVYAAPYVQKVRDRKKGSAEPKGLNHIHADIDGPLDLEKLAAVGGWAVASGTPGHGHAYVTLSAAVSLTQHAALSKQLGVFLGDADAKFNANDILRVPGTFNFKAVARGLATTPTPVGWMVEPTGPVAVEHVAAMLSVDLGNPEASLPTAAVALVSGAPVSKDLEPFNIFQHPRIVHALSVESGHRAQDTFGIVAACADAGLTLENARFAVAQRPDILQRMSERTDDDVFSCWNKVVSERKEAASEAPDAGRTGSRGLVPDATVCDRTAWFEHTEFGVRDRWVAHYGEDFRWDVAESMWRRWDGTLWAPVSASEHRATIETVIRSIGEIEADLLADSDPLLMLEKQQKHKAFGKAFSTAAKVKAVAELCVSAPECQLPSGVKWNANPLLVNAPRGTWDVQAGVLRPHSREDYITMVTEGDPETLDVASPHLDRVLAGLATADPSIPAVLQSVCATAVTGLTTDSFTHVWGAPRIGKSTILEALFAALGGGGATSYAAAMSPKVLEAVRTGGGDSADPTLHAARDKRFWFVDEFSKVRAATDLIKALTGGVTMTTRALYKASVSWTPAATIIATGNDRISVPDSDTGFAERLVAVRIERPGHHTVDPSLRDVLVHSQAGKDAVLAWALRRAVEMLDGGTTLSVADLSLSQFVLDERDAYIAAMDPLLAWWEERVVVLDEPRVGSAAAPVMSELNRDYQTWAAENGQHTMGLRNFAARVEAKLAELGLPLPTARTVRNRQFAPVRGAFVEAVELFDNRGDF